MEAQAIRVNWVLILGVGVLISASLVAGCLTPDVDPLNEEPEARVQGAALVDEAAPEPHHPQVPNATQKSANASEDQSAQRPLLAGSPLYVDPRTTPHPAFGWATVSWPAENAPSHWRPLPLRAVPGQVTGLVSHGVPERAGPGAGLAVFGSLAAVAGWHDSGTLYDISDPARPTKVGDLPIGQDVGFIAYPDGRLIAAFTGSDAEIPVMDLTDPTAPTQIATITGLSDTHNLAVVPGTPILYNANDMGEGHPVEIVDLSDPAQPQVEAFEGGYGCHDISFHLDPAAERFRAYCAGVQATQIWDIANPRKPLIVATLPFPHANGEVPSLTQVKPFLWSHGAVVDPTTALLVVGDETGGRITGSCDASIHTDVGTISGPLGNLYLYDISDERSPQLISWFSPTVGESTVCTSHFGDFVAHPERTLFALGAYQAGILLYDLTDPARPRLISQISDGRDTWEVLHIGGYLFSGDLRRGLEVLRLAG